MKYVSEDKQKVGIFFDCLSITEESWDEYKKDCVRNFRNGLTRTKMTETLAQTFVQNKASVSVVLCGLDVHYKKREWSVWGKLKIHPAQPKSPCES